MLWFSVTKGPHTVNFQATKSPYLSKAQCCFWIAISASHSGEWFVVIGTNLLLNVFIANTDYQRTWIKPCTCIYLTKDSLHQTQSQRLVFWCYNIWLPSVRYIRIADIRRDQMLLDGARLCSDHFCACREKYPIDMYDMFSGAETLDQKVRWGAPSVFSSGKLRAPWLPTLQRKAGLYTPTPTQIWYHCYPNLVSLCSDHLCACRKKYTIAIYA